MAPVIAGTAAHGEYEGHDAHAPWNHLPPGRNVRLPSGRATFIRELPGPPGAPVLILLHGLMVTADLNWFGTFAPLGERYRVIAMDLPGHGHSPLRQRPFRLEDCADDVAALATALEIPRFIAVGYSMGGLIAQLVWQRHPQSVAGLVLCSTARNFAGSPLERLTSLMLPGIASWMQFNPVLHLVGSGAFGLNALGNVGDRGLSSWAHREMDRTSMATTVSAIGEVLRFTSHGWIGRANVPVAVVVTTRDQIVPVIRQRRLAAAIAACSIHEINGDHGVCISDPARFAEVLMAACHSVESTPSVTC